VTREAGAIAFTDLVGFTEFTATHGDDAALHLLALQDRIVADVLPENARVVKELGDGLLVWFDDACDAVTTALALLARFDATADAEQVPLWGRVGVHWGSPSRRGSDLVGHDVNLASRIVDVAAPGEALCSAPVVTQSSARLPDIRFVELGPVVMKGLPEPVALFRAEPAHAVH
jgi:adenylate cyclase